VLRNLRFPTLQFSFARQNRAGVATTRVFSTRGRKNEVGHEAAIKKVKLIKKKNKKFIKNH
jgi:hypothetical protein